MHAYSNHVNQISFAMEHVVSNWRSLGFEICVDKTLNAPLELVHPVNVFEFDFDENDCWILVRERKLSTMTYSRKD